MATNTEIRTMQKTTLFDYLRIEKSLAGTGSSITKELKETIIRQKASMEQEDVAWVEKMISQL